MHGSRHGLRLGAADGILARGAPPHPRPLGPAGPAGAPPLPGLLTLQRRRSSEGTGVESARRTPSAEPLRPAGGSPPLDQTRASAGCVPERRPPRVARLPVSAAFCLGAAEPGTNARRVLFIAQLFACIFERLMCTVILINS